MAFAPFADWRPDVSDLAGRSTQRMRNVVPRDDGYGPWPSLQKLTQSLPGPCRGYFFALHPSGVYIFAGTVDRLYLLDNSTFIWEDVSLGGVPYTTLASDAMWQFAQFGNFVLATHRNVVLQRFDMSSPATFVNCPGSPPQAGAIAVVNSFVVLADLAGNPFRVKWSGLNNVTEWTPGVGLSGQQDFPTGGRCLNVAEMSQDVGIILQEGGWRRMAFLPGDVELVFDIDRLRDEAGLLAQYSLAVASGQAYFLSTKGFMQVGIDGSFAAIGEEKVDRTFLRQSNSPLLGDLAYDDGAPHMVIGATDPRHNRVVWVYQSIVGTPGLFDKGLVYQRGRWSPIEVSGEYLAQIVKPSLTLEALDAIAPGAIPITDVTDNGGGLIRITVASTATLTTGDFKTITGVGGVPNANGSWTITVINGTQFDLQGSTFAGAYTVGGVVAGSLDALPFSLDSVSTATLPGLSAFGPDHSMGFFTGAPVEARLETSEQRAEGRRANINQLWPRTDAGTVFGFISQRQRLDSPYIDGAESEMLEDGNCPIFEEARNGRACIRIPAGTQWTFATGIEIDAGEAGEW